MGIYIVTRQFDKSVQICEPRRFNQLAIEKLRQFRFEGEGFAKTAKLSAFVVTERTVTLKITAADEWAEMIEKEGFQDTIIAYMFNLFGSEYRDDEKPSVVATH